MNNVYVPGWLQEAIKRAKEDMAKIPPEYRPQIRLNVHDPNCQGEHQPIYQNDGHNFQELAYWKCPECGHKIG